MTASELKRLLKAKGCTFEDATRHTLVFRSSKSTIMPRHPSQEIKKETLESILRTLDLK